MRGRMIGRRPISAIVGACALGLGLASCASSPGGTDPGETLGNLFAFNSPTRPPVDPSKQAPVVYDIVCPIVDVKEGGAAHRVYSGRGTANKDVRYQFSIGQTARECKPENGQLAIRVGVEGKVLLGPAGRASTFNVPVSIAVRDEGTGQILDTKIYRPAVTVPPGQQNTAFSVVSETIYVPLRRKEANEDYLIIVGFEKAKANRQPRRRISRRRR